MMRVREQFISAITYVITGKIFVNGPQNLFNYKLIKKKKYLKLTNDCNVCKIAEMQQGV